MKRCFLILKFSVLFALLNSSALAQFYAVPKAPKSEFSKSQNKDSSLLKIMNVENQKLKVGDPEVDYLGIGEIFNEPDKNNFRVIPSVVPKQKPNILLKENIQPESIANEGNEGIGCECVGSRMFCNPGSNCNFLNDSPVTNSDDNNGGSGIEALGKPLTIISLANDVLLSKEFNLIRGTKTFCDKCLIEAVLKYGDHGLKEGESNKAFSKYQPRYKEPSLQVKSKKELIQGDLLQRVLTNRLKRKFKALNELRNLNDKIQALDSAPGVKSYKNKCQNAEKINNYIDIRMRTRDGCQLNSVNKRLSSILGDKASQNILSNLQELNQQNQLKYTCNIDKFEKTKIAYDTYKQIAGNLRKNLEPAFMGGEKSTIASICSNEDIINVNMVEHLIAANKSKSKKVIRDELNNVLSLNPILQSIFLTKKSFCEHYYETSGKLDSFLDPSSFNYDSYNLNSDNSICEDIYRDISGLLCSDIKKIKPAPDEIELAARELLNNDKNNNLARIALSSAACSISEVETDSRSEIQLLEDLEDYKNKNYTAKINYINKQKCIQRDAQKLNAEYREHKGAQAALSDTSRKEVELVDIPTGAYSRVMEINQGPFDDLNNGEPVFSSAVHNNGEGSKDPFKLGPPFQEYENKTGTKGQDDNIGLEPNRPLSTLDYGNDQEGITAPIIAPTPEPILETDESSENAIISYDEVMESLENNASQIPMIEQGLMSSFNLTNAQSISDMVTATGVSDLEEESLKEAIEEIVEDPSLTPEEIDEKLKKAKKLAAKKDELETEAKELEELVQLKEKVLKLQKEVATQKEEIKESAKKKVTKEAKQKVATQKERLNTIKDQPLKRLIPKRLSGDESSSFTGDKLLPRKADSSYFKNASLNKQFKKSYNRALNQIYENRSKSASGSLGLKVDDTSSQGSSLAAFSIKLADESTTQITPSNIVFLGSKIKEIRVKGKPPILYDSIPEAQKSLIEEYLKDEILSREKALIEASEKMIEYFESDKGYEYLKSTIAKETSE